MEHVKVYRFRAGCGKQANGERDKTKADITLPNGGRHSQLDSISALAVSLCHRACGFQAMRTTPGKSASPCTRRGTELSKGSAVQRKS